MLMKHLAMETPSTDGLGIISEETPVSFTQIAKEARRLEKSLSHYVDGSSLVGTEGISSFIRGMITSLVNIVGHIVNTFKTNIFKFWKDQKRTELRYYHESNIASVRYIFSRQYEDLEDYKVDYPNKMDSPYLKTATTITDFLAYLGMLDKMKALANQYKSVLSRIESSGDTTLSEPLEATFNYPLVTIGKEFKKVTSCFGGAEAIGDQNVKKSFGKLFKNMKEFKDTDTVILSGEKYCYEVSKVYDILKDMEERTTKFLKYIETATNPNLTKETYQSLAAYCTSVARLCDMYGYTMHDYQRVEHNYCMVLNYFKKELK